MGNPTTDERASRTVIVPPPPEPDDDFRWPDEFWDNVPDDNWLDY